jgi:hypothetical protein
MKPTQVTAVHPRKKHNLPMWGGLNSSKIFLLVFLKGKLTNALGFEVQFRKK